MIYIDPRTGRPAPCEIIHHHRWTNSRGREQERVWIRVDRRDLIVEPRSLCRDDQLDERRGYTEPELPL